MNIEWMFIPIYAMIVLGSIVMGGLLIWEAWSLSTHTLTRVRVRGLRLTRTPTADDDGGKEQT